MAKSTADKPGAPLEDNNEDIREATSSEDVKAETASEDSGAAEAESEVVAEAEAILEEAANAAEEAQEETPSAEDEVAEWKGKYLRLQAEWDTYRRRMNEQRAAEKILAAEKIAEDLIPIIDDFERTIDYATENGETGLLDGVKAVHSKFLGVLGKHGLETIDPKGEAYDALEAQAVAVVENPDVPDETVADVYQKGYKMGSKVLRSAMVTVTSGGPKREVEEE